MSPAVRKKVGGLLVRDHTIISDGFNGTISGFDNCCETDEGTTKEEVIHAEMNCILKLTHNANVAPGSTMYLTLTPCKPCTKVVIRAGVTRIVASEFYRDIDALEWIFKKNIRFTYVNVGKLCDNYHPLY
jgi:dCMP deaminase